MSASYGKAARSPTSPELNRLGGHFRAADEDTVELIARLAADHDDTTIAVILDRQQRRTASGLHFTKSRVASVRVAKEILEFAKPAVVSPPDDNAVVVGIIQAERMLAVSNATIYRWLRDGSAWPVGLAHPHRRRAQGQGRGRGS
jgi:hypothetical protein